jgi:catechol 2,3-dioxygenase-like lactoylglutathione lyase family enzyme
MVDYTQGFSTFAVPDLAAAKAFYTEVLGLAMTEEEPTGTVALTLPGGAQAMVYQKDDHQPAGFTILHLGVADLAGAVDALSERGAVWQRYDGFEQDERGIVSNPDFGPDIAWTTDPGGNIIGLMQLDAGDLRDRQR